MKKLVKIFVLFLMSVFHTSCGQNQTNVSKDNIKKPYTWSETKDSITFNSMVRNIKQDRNGNILIAYNKGVVRYDGKSFTNLTSNAGSPIFWDVLDDRKGNLWLATRDSGVYYYNEKSLPAGQAGFQHFTTKDGLANNRVTSIYEDKAGIIWFGTVGGVSRYDGKSFRNFTTKDGLPDNSIGSIIEDKTGKIWFVTGGELCFYDGKTFTIFRNKDGRSFNSVGSIIEDRKGNIWFDAFLLNDKKRISPGGVIWYGDGGLWRYDGNSITKVSQMRTNAIIEDKKGNIWTNGNPKPNGQAWALSRFDQKSLYNQKPTVTEIMLGGPYYLNAAIRGILEANDGSIWFGGAKGGLSRYDGKTIMVF